MADYYSIITNRGKELEAEALASGRLIVLTHFVVGDSNGKQVKPDPSQIRLINETYRGDIAELVVSPEQSTQLMAKIVLPTGVGGFTVREVGLMTDAGELYAVANCPSIDKPVGGVSVNMQFRLAVSDTSNITLNVATGDGLFLRIDQNLKEIKARGAEAQKTSRESIGVLDGTTQQRGLVQLNSAVNSTSETQAATPAAVKIAMDNANARLAKDRNGGDIPNVALFLQNLGIDRIDQDSNETRIWSPDGKNYIFVQNGVWGAYSINSPAGALSLGLGFGGTGATDAAGARTNLGLGDSSTRDVGTVSGTVAAGDDSRITGAMQQNQNGNDIPDKAEFRSNIGLGSAATRAVGNGANQIPDMSFFSAALAINGWAKLPNGLIIQQGTSTAATPSSPDVLVNFPIPFPTGVLHIGEHDSNGGLSMTLWQLNNITRTAFYAGALGGVTRGNTTIRALATSAACNWFAIGY
ncbi:phage tail protein [Citrobacter portucalensis]|uniref:phage tail protein n=2 Tax=Citrobacter portucalensis TaxID=1639133 RepID=UPI00216AB578|nr:phage tail protein [Citrobacter portucalensis]MDE9690886.1 phage tail protein [Citrobacter portucalensis]WOU50983.1 phage tail protein [Citrobacter portucalensis]